MSKRQLQVWKYLDGKGEMTVKEIADALGFKDHDWARHALVRMSGKGNVNRIGASHWAAVPNFPPIDGRAANQLRRQQIQMERVARLRPPKPQTALEKHWGWGVTSDWLAQLLQKDRQYAGEVTPSENVEEPVN
jgi:hypothetical protein